MLRIIRGGRMGEGSCRLTIQQCPKSIHSDITVNHLGTGKPCTLIDAHHAGHRPEARDRHRGGDGAAHVRRPAGWPTEAVGRWSRGNGNRWDGRYRDVESNQCYIQLEYLIIYLYT